MGELVTEDGVANVDGHPTEDQRTEDLALRGIGAKSDAGLARSGHVVEENALVFVFEAYAKGPEEILPAQQPEA